MGVHIVDSKLSVSTEPKTFCFDLPDNNLTQEVYSIIKHNKLLAENTIKNEVRQFLTKYKHGNDIYEHGKQQNE